MMRMLTRNVMVVCSLAVFCLAVMGCSSSDDGKLAELERQLDMEAAARMTAEQEREAAKAAQAASEAARMAAEQERDDAKAAQMTAKEAQAAAEAAKVAAEQAQATAVAARMAAEQERDDAQADQMTAKEAQAAAEAARATAEQAQATAETARMAAEQGRDDAQAAQMTAEEAQAAAEAARMTAEQERDAAKDELADFHFDARVANEIKKVAAPGQPHRCALDTGCGSDSGVDYSSVSITYDIGYRWHGERLIHAIPWRGDDGQVEFIVRVMPEPLQGDFEVFTFTDLRTPDRNGDIAGSTTSYSPLEDHGLGSQWQGFEAMKAYDGGGTLTVRFFTDLEEADNPLTPYTNWEADLPEEEILLNDDRVPDLTGRDSLYFSIPEDGLKGTLDGVAGTFTCPEGYCSLTTSWVGPGYIPWADSAPVLFTPDGAGQPKSVRPTHLVSPSAEVPKVDYLSLGSWLYVPEDTTDFDAFRFGLFAGGDDPFMGSNLPGLAGTAKYAGRATGMYVETVVPDVDTFSADVALTADFGSENESGMIAGSVSNFELGSGRSSPLSELLLEADDYDGDGPGANIFPGWPGDNEHFLPGGFVGGPANSPAGPEEGWWGEWGGRFFGNGNTAADQPTSFAGTFGATDGERSFAGSFGTYKQ